MLKIAIIEDGPEDRERLNKILCKYNEECPVPMDISTFESGEQFLTAPSLNYEVVFMDIEMGRMNGIETAAIVRKKNKDAFIFLTTSHTQYAIQGYSVAATDFIVKPVEYSRIKEHMDRIVTQYLKTKKSIVVKQKSGLKKIPVAQIRYIEVYGHKLLINTGMEQIEVIGTLKNWVQDLKDYGFVKCNKCYLVNLRYVNRIENGNVKVENQWLEISRREKKSFIEAFTNYLRY